MYNGKLNNETAYSLAATQTDDQLMKSLQSHFGKFGRLHVKIRRDTKSNPYSFCQFEVIITLVINLFLFY